MRLSWWKLGLVGAAVAVGTVVLLVVGAGRVSDQVNPEIELLRERIDDLTAENARLLQAVDDLTAENDHLRRELATILVLLEEVDGLGPRIRELRELQIRDLSGEDERDTSPPPDEPEPEPEPSPDDDPSPSPEPQPDPSPEPEPSPSPGGGILDDLFPDGLPGRSDGRTATSRPRAPPRRALLHVTLPA